MLCVAMLMLSKVNDSRGRYRSRRDLLVPARILVGAPSSVSYHISFFFECVCLNNSQTNKCQVVFKKYNVLPPFSFANGSETWSFTFK